MKRKSIHGVRLRIFLKDILKKRDFHYRDVAQALGVSLATFKRMMTESDFSFEDLVALSNWLGLSLEELLSASVPEQETSTYTRAQEEFMVLNPVAAYVFIHILTGKKASEICSDLKVTRIELEKIVLKLDKVKLVEAFPGGRFRCPFQGPFKWIKGGPLESHYLPKFARVVYAALVDGQRGLKPIPTPENTTYFRSFEMYVLPETYFQFVRDLEEVIGRYRRHSIVERYQVPSKALKPVSGLVAFDFLNAWKEVFLGDQSNTELS